MSSIVRKSSRWVWQNLSKLAALIAILTAAGSFLGELHPFIWQGALVILLALGSYEVGFNKGRSSSTNDLETQSTSDGTPSYVKRDEELMNEAKQKLGVVYRA